MENEIILKKEMEIKEIFFKNNIRRLDVIKGNRLIHEWELLTNYKSDKTPILDVASQQILDDDPIWNKNLNNKL